VAYVSDAEAIRSAMLARDHGADLIFSSGNNISRFRALASVGIPFVGHVGLVPSRSTWLGGLRAVGKTIGEAVKVYQDTIDFQEAGAVAVEMECVPSGIAAEITKRVSLLTISLGSGRDCDGQFLFSCDLLGTYEPRYPGLNRPYEGPYPRHAKKYADLYGAAVEAFATFKQEVDRGEFPADGNTIHVDGDLIETFRARISGT
jgi:3-methyl-2-oxobutanoate hydroxymethyltransferase